MRVATDELARVARELCQHVGGAEQPRDAVPLVTLVRDDAEEHPLDRHRVPLGLEPELLLKRLEDVYAQVGDLHLDKLLRVSCVPGVCATVAARPAGAP